MNQEIKEKWVKALRSGKYKQGGGFLRKGDRFCCLGVLCDVVDPEGWGEWDSYTNSRPHFSCHLLPGPEVLVDVGTNILSVRKLSFMNDVERKSFQEIANYIEGRL